MHIWIVDQKNLESSSSKSIWVSSTQCDQGMWFSTPTTRPAENRACVTKPLSNHSRNAPGAGLGVWMSLPLPFPRTSVGLFCTVHDAKMDEIILLPSSLAVIKFKCKWPPNFKQFFNQQCTNIWIPICGHLLSGKPTKVRNIGKILTFHQANHIALSLSALCIYILLDCKCLLYSGSFTTQKCLGTSFIKWWLTSLNAQHEMTPKPPTCWAPRNSSAAIAGTLRRDRRAIIKAEKHTPKKGESTNRFAWVSWGF